MEINYVLSTYPTLLQNMVAKVYETNAPLAVVQEFIIVETNAGGTPVAGGGHNKQATVTFNGLDLVPHILRLFTASGTQLQEFNVQPYRDEITVFDPIYFKIGAGGTFTPVAGTFTYTNPNLGGLINGQAVIHRSGVLMYPGVHYNMLPGGGFTLAVAGDIFGADEEFLFQQAPQVIANPINDSVVGKQWGPTTGNTNMFVDVTGHVSYVATHLRKLIRISGAGAYHFNSAVPIGYPFRFTNQVGGNPVVFFDTAPLIQPSGDTPSIVVPTGGILEVVFDGTKFNMTINNTDSLGQLPFASLTYVGAINIGDVISAGTSYTIAIPTQPSAGYKVFGAFKSVSSANKVADTTGIWTVTSQSTTSFTITTREVMNGIQNLLFDYIIVTIN